MRSDVAVEAPRLGFLGLGWIGRMRMDSIVRCGATAAVIADLDPDRLEDVEGADGAERISGPDCLDALIEARPDGIVIATPSALHAAQSIAALEAGIPVFCQKPLGRSALEAGRVVEAARRADRLLGLDLSYRHVRGAGRIRELVRDGAIGDVFAAELVFHNAYGPDQPWFYDARLSGGGCLIDLGVHLVDLALWTLDFPEVTGSAARLFARGRPYEALPSDGTVEDFASARLDLATGANVSLACSWNLSAGCDAVIAASFYGTDGALSMRNVDGSFFDFRTEWHHGRDSRLLECPPDDWGGRALAAWTEAISLSPRFDPAIERVVEVSEVLDALYGRRADREALPIPGAPP
jgi:predicted dehydrogenase